jgi:hypothetical protein
MHKFKFILVLSLGLLFLLSSLSFAQNQRSYTTGVVDLTEEQLLKIEELRLAFQEELLPLRSRLRTGYMELDLMEAKAEDPKKIDAKFAELTELENEIEKRYLAHDQEIRELLTDEQKVLFDRWGGLGLGMGYGPGWNRGHGYSRGASWGRGRGFGRGAAWSRGAGRGMARATAWDRSYMRNPRLGQSYARGVRWDRGYARDGSWKRGYGRAVSRGAGWYCPRGIGMAGKAFYRNRRIRWEE